MWSILRIYSAFLLPIIQLFQVFAMSQINFNLNIQENSAFDGYSLVNISGITSTQCFEHCLLNCLCMSFDMCSNDKCLLRSSKKELESSKIIVLNGCSHFEFQENENQQCNRICTSSVINCCLISNPCENGGTCLSPKNNNDRFHCACPERFVGKRCEKCSSGYTGDLCEQRITSCRGYANGLRIAGKYTIFNASGVRYEVYCDFDANSKMTWTLIQTYSLANNVVFSSISLVQDVPIEPQGSDFWESFRLSKSKMESIRDDSKKWRLTCEFDKTKQALERDSIRASIDQVDILTFAGIPGCHIVEYLNVRGFNCSNCFIPLYQRKDSYALHFDSYNSNIADKVHKCVLPVIKESLNCGDSGGEDDFGHYKCKNVKHRCVTHPDSTTQTWFGG